MGLGIIEDALRRAVGGQGLQYEAVAHVSGAGVQLTVRKGACAALAELDVGLRIQHPGFPEPFHVLRPPLHVPAALQQDGTRAAPGQSQSAEQASGSRAHHDRWDLRRIDGVRQMIRCLADRRDIFIFTAFQYGFFVSDCRPKGIDEPNALPGVDGPAKDLDLQHIRLWNPQSRRGPAPQEAFVLLQLQLYPFNLKHVPSPFHIRPGIPARRRSVPPPPAAAGPPAPAPGS